MSLRIRDALPSDAAAVAALATHLGYPSSPAEVADRLGGLDGRHAGLIVAELDAVCGCLSWVITPVVHRPRPVGRISMLVVNPSARGCGAGRALVEATERLFEARGCGLAEVTSNLVREDAHRFYLHLGYEKTSFRFGKTLA